MNDFRYLVTGANGCIGAWVVRNLVDEGAAVIALDASRDDHRLKLIMNPVQLARVNPIQADITDLNTLEAVIKEQGITHLIHLAALQTPACKADPSLGARINVVGTVNLFEAARKSGIRHLAYASSIGVFGLSEEYPDGIVKDDSDPRPRSFYGVYKQANESTARVYWWDHGISSIGLRPYVVYGPGRDQGMTSSPTWAMLAAAAGRPYQITYGGRSGLNYVDDIARLFIQASRVSPGGAETLNVSGSLVDMPEILQAIFQQIPEARQWISFSPTHLPFPDGMEDKKLRAMLPGFQETSLNEGVARTIALFRQALRDGRVRADQIPGMTTLLATAIGAAAAQILTAGETGSVNGITSRGIFCATPAGQVIFVSYESWRGALTINLVPIYLAGEDPSFLKADFRRAAAPFEKITPGSPVRMQVGQLQWLEPDVRVISGHLTPWNLIGGDPQNADMLAVRRRLRLVLSQLQEKNAGKGWIEYGATWTHGPIPGSSNSSMPIPTDQLDLLRDGLKTGSPEIMLSAVSGLLGKGGGLTPSGDDVVIGLLLALSRRKPGDILPIQDIQAFIRRVITLAREQTTWLGASLIACAAQGQADERLVTVLEGILQGNLEPGECAARLAGYGHSSGGDTLLGMALGLDP